LPCQVLALLEDDVVLGPSKELHDFDWGIELFLEHPLHLLVARN
jgi:hypothetical protein